MDAKTEIRAMVVECKETKKSSGIYFLCLQAKEFSDMDVEPCQFVTLEPLKKTSVMPRPFIVAWHTGRNKIWLYIDTVGDSNSNTRQYAKLKKKDYIMVSGLKGKGFCPDDKSFNEYILVGGGVGIATLFLLAKKIKELGKKVRVLIGAKNELGIIDPDLFKTLEIEPEIITENACDSCNQGLVTDLLKKALTKKKSLRAVVACGPRLMLKEVAKICKKHHYSCFVAVEEVMACGTGSCKGCAIKGVDKTYKHVCLDGPIFDANWIDWKKFIKPPAAKIVSKGKKTKKPMQIILSGQEGRSLKLLSPLLNASGCLGLEEALNNPYLDKAGALVTKGIMFNPRGGNKAPRVCEVPAGMINAIGLEGIGIDRFISEELPSWLNEKKPIIVNISGETIEEYVNIARKLASLPIVAVEINISCGNIKKGGMAFGTDHNQTFAVVSKIRKILPEKFLIAKLTPNVTDIVQIAKAAVRGGVDALSMINTVSAMAIDILTRRPKIGNNYGGLSGQVIMPIGIVMVSKVYQANLGVPIIGMGGIKNGKDALQYIIAGASAVMIGTGWFSNKAVFNETYDTILNYLKEYNINRVQDLVGTLKFYEKN